LGINISDKLTNEEKVLLGNLSRQVKVLESLLQEKKMIFNKVAGDIMKKATKNPELYNFYFSPGKDIWELQLKKELQVQQIDTSISVTMTRLIELAVVWNQ